MSKFNFNGNFNFNDSNVVIGDVINSNLNFSNKEKEVIKTLIDSLSSDKKGEAIEALSTLSNPKKTNDDKVSAGKLLLEMTKGVAQSIGKNSTNAITGLITTYAPALLEYAEKLFL